MKNKNIVINDKVAFYSENVGGYGQYQTIFLEPRVDFNST